MQLSEVESFVLRRAFSPERIQDRFNVEIEDPLGAAELYYLDMLLSAELMVPLRVVELTIRSSVHTLLSNKVGEWWFDQPKFVYRGLKWEQRERNALHQARKHANREHWPQASIEQVISRTPLNFWVRCFSGKYENQLWHPHLKPLFPEKHVKRRDVHDRLEYLRVLRNRIAHHNIITPEEADECVQRVKFILENLKISDGAVTRPILKMLETSFATITLRTGEMRELMPAQTV